LKEIRFEFADNYYKNVFPNKKKMGLVSSSQGNSDDLGGLTHIPSNLRKMELKIDILKEVKQSLYQLLYCNHP
jgi:hypothetical protein